MEDSELYNELNDYNQGHKNKYEEHWGTLLNFLDESKLDEATISRLTRPEDDNESFLQNHDLMDDLKDQRRPRNMADMYDALSNVPERTTAKSGKRGAQTASPDVNYVYQSKK